MTTIVGVHGVGNHRPGHGPSAVATHLADTWRTALTSGPLGTLPDHVTLTAAYYSHRLRPPGTQQSGGDRLDRLPPEVQAQVNQWLHTLTPDPGTAQGHGTALLRRGIAALASRRRLNQLTVERFVATFFTEVTRYLDPDPTPRTLARTEVANTIAAANRDHHTTIVLAHSLGSVVTYETLHAYPHLTVDHLITIGSPLALPHVVYHRLDPTPQPL